MNTNQGSGVSWSYILRNPSLALLIRRSPLGGIIAQARLGAECLWRLTPRRALDELDALVRRMWASPLPFRRGEKADMARWQVSQIHLAVDVANAPLELEQANRYVSRSRSQAVYNAARGEIEKLLQAVDGEDGGSVPLVMDWDALYADDAFDDDAFAFGMERGGDVEPEPMEDRAATLFRFGRRVSGMTFSPGGDVSMVIYDKVLQARLSGKRHMEPIWAAVGWRAGVSVSRHEARLRRPAVRELGLVGEARSCLDDPWECLSHLKDILGAVVGHSAPCPDATDVAWIRRVVPDAADRNQSRWPTDPTWRAVQSATFADAPAEVRRLIRRRQRGGDVAVLDQVEFGCLVSRVANLHPNGGAWTLSRALGEALPALAALETKKSQAGRDFGELVRERRRQRGLPLPIADKVLPFRIGAQREELGFDEPAPTVMWSDAQGGNREAVPYGEQLEERLTEARLRLAASERAGAPPRVLQELETAYLRELARFKATHEDAPLSHGDAPVL